MRPENSHVSADDMVSFPVLQTEDKDGNVRRYKLSSEVSSKSQRVEVTVRGVQPVVMATSVESEVDSDVLKRRIKGRKKYDLEHLHPEKAIRNFPVDRLRRGNPMVQVGENRWYGHNALCEGREENRGNFQKAIYISTLLIDSKHPAIEKISHTLFDTQNWLSAMKFDETTFLKWMDLRYECLMLKETESERRVLDTPYKWIIQRPALLEEMGLSQQAASFLKERLREVRRLDVQLITVLGKAMAFGGLDNAEQSKVIFVGCLSMSSEAMGGGRTGWRKTIKTTMLDHFTEKIDRFTTIVGVLVEASCAVAFCIDYETREIYLVYSGGDGEDELKEEWKRMNVVVHSLALLGLILIRNKNGIHVPRQAEETTRHKMQRMIQGHKYFSGKESPLRKKKLPEIVKILRMESSENAWPIIQSRSFHRVQYGELYSDIFALWMIRVFAHGLHRALDLIYLPLHVMTAQKDSHKNSIECAKKTAPIRKYMLKLLETMLRKKQ